MSTDTSVPKPRVSGVEASDSALLDTLFREAPIGFAFFDTDLRFRRVNRTLARLHGIRDEDHLGRKPSEVWPTALATRAEAALRRVLDDDQPVLETYQPVIAAEAPQAPAEEAPADRQRHWAFSWFPCHDSRATMTGVVLIADDITDRQHSAEAVRRSEARYRSLVQAGAQVVWVTTPTGEVAEDSPEWR